jgi:DnaJ-class molecular chaperone
LIEAINGVQRRIRSGGRSLDVTIPAGVRDGSRVSVRGAGPDGSDLYLIVQLEAHPSLEPEGAHLRTVVRVDLYDALLGGSAEVPTPEGAVSLTIPPGTANGRVFRINGRGMPDAKQQNRRGDVLAKVEVVLPESLGEEERRLVERLRGLRKGRGGGAGRS